MLENKADFCHTFIPPFPPPLSLSWCSIIRALKGMWNDVCDCSHFETAASLFLFSLFQGCAQAAVALSKWECLLQVLHFPSEWHYVVSGVSISSSTFFSPFINLYNHWLSLTLHLTVANSYTFCPMFYVHRYAFAPEMPFLVWNCCRSRVGWEQDWCHANTHQKFSVIFIKTRIIWDPDWPNLQRSRVKATTMKLSS